MIVIYKYNIYGFNQHTMKCIQDSYMCIPAIVLLTAEMGLEVLTFLN